MSGEVLTMHTLGVGATGHLDAISLQSRTVAVTVSEPSLATYAEPSGQGIGKHLRWAASSMR